METKRCSRCGNTKPVSEFGKRPERKSGYLSHCKECKRISARDRWKRKHQSMRDGAEKYQLLAAGQQRCTKCKTVKALNGANFPPEPRNRSGHSSHCRDCINAYARKQMESKRADPAQNAKVKAWRDKHSKSPKGKEGKRIRNAVRNHKRRTLTFKWTTKDWAACKLHFGNKCAYCGSDGVLTQDHFIPISHPDCPGTVPENMVPACGRCNFTKQAKHPIGWASREAIERIRRYFATLLEGKS